VKKIGFLLLVLTLSRVAVAYAATTTTPATNQNFFFGNSASGNAALNQVLALLVGPKGDPGPAGVAGKDGFVGMNGQNGQDGLPGAPGAVGPQGPAGPAGATGPRGPAGPAGANGTNGTGGTGGGAGGTFAFADGQILVNNCQPANETVTVGVDRFFVNDTVTSNSEFRFADFKFSNIDAACSAKVLKVEINVKASGLSSGKSYQANDQILCSVNSTIAAATTGSVTTVSDSSATCSIYRGATLIGPIQLASINTLDFTGSIGFQIADA